MKKLLYAVCLTLASVPWIHAAPDSTPAAPAPAQPAQIDLYDVAAMAALMPADKDYYQKLRKDLLSQYSSQHSTPSPYDDEAKEVLRLAAYDMTWGDFYREGVLKDMTHFAQAAQESGCNDPLLTDIYSIAAFGTQNSYDPIAEARSVTIANEMISAAQRSSPASLRLWQSETGIMAILRSDANAQTPPPPSQQLLSKLIPLWEQALAEMIKTKASSSIIDLQVSILLNACESSESTLDLVSAAIDQAYNETGTASGLRLAFDGDYYICSAWAARGSDLANTVITQQWQLFNLRLLNARQILESANTLYPNEPAISDLMLVVALGGFDRNTMEMWFQRALKTLESG